MPPDEVEPGDAIRDHGHWRTVDHIEPQLLELSILIHFTDTENGTLRVPIGQTISLWRVAR